ncbi:MAG: hypothetical protein ACK559_07490, partial [bacterium]
VAMGAFGGMHPASAATLRRIGADIDATAPADPVEGDPKAGRRLLVRATLECVAGGARGVLAIRDEGLAKPRPRRSSDEPVVWSTRDVALAGYALRSGERHSQPACWRGGSEAQRQRQCGRGGLRA